MPWHMPRSWPSSSAGCAKAGDCLIVHAPLLQVHPEPPGLSTHQGCEQACAHLVRLGQVEEEGVCLAVVPLREAIFLDVALRHRDDAAQTVGRELCGRAGQAVAAPRAGEVFRAVPCNCRRPNPAPAAVKWVLGHAPCPAPRRLALPLDCLLLLSEPQAPPVRGPHSPPLALACPDRPCPARSPSAAIWARCS